jgi:hypothetical protein
MQAAIRKVRSLSPFRRRKTARQLIDDVGQKEKDMMTDLVQKRSNLAAIEVMLDDESTPIHTNAQMNVKRSPSTRIDKYKTNGDSDTATPATASTTEDSPNRRRRTGYPISQLKRQQSFRDKFKRIRSLKNKRDAEEMPQPPPEIPRTVTSRGRSLKRDHEPREEMNWLPVCMPSSASVAVASTTGVGMVDDEFDDISGPSKVSELSSPLTLQRAESLGDVSIAQIRNVLQTMERRLHTAERTGSRVCRAQVIKALMKVADSVDSVDERDAMYRELANMVGKQTHGNEKQGQLDESSYVDEEEEDDESSEESSSDSDSEDDAETYSQGTSTIQPEASTFDFFASFGKFFSGARDEKAEAKQVLDDLLSFEKARGDRDRRDESESERVGQLNRIWGDSFWDVSSDSSSRSSSVWLPPALSSTDHRSQALARHSPFSQPERKKVDKGFNFQNSRHRSHRSARPASPSSDDESGGTPANAHEKFNLERLPGFNYHEAKNTRHRPWRDGSSGNVIY